MSKPYVLREWVDQSTMTRVRVVAQPPEANAVAGGPADFTNLVAERQDGRDATGETCWRACDRPDLISIAVFNYFTHWLDAMHVSKEKTA
jgi:hypothetical protein